MESLRNRQRTSRVAKAAQFGTRSRSQPGDRAGNESGRIERDLLSEVCSLSLNHLGQWNQLLSKSSLSSHAAEVPSSEPNQEGSIFTDTIVSTRRRADETEEPEEIEGQRYYCYQNELLCWALIIHENFLTEYWHIETFEGESTRSLITLVFLSNTEDLTTTSLPSPTRQLASMKDYLEIRLVTAESLESRRDRFSSERSISLPINSASSSVSPTRKVNFFGFENSVEFESLNAPGASSVALFEADEPGIDIFKIDKDVIEDKEEAYQQQFKMRYEALCRESAERVLETWKQTSASGGEWDDMGPIENIEVVQSRKQSLFEQYPDERSTCCVVCTAPNVKVPWKFAMEYIQEPTHQCQWNGLFDSAEVVEEVPDCVAKIVHLTYKPTWPVRGQDYCVLTGAHEIEGLGVISERSVAHSNCPVDPDFRRSLRLDCGFVIEGTGTDCKIHSISRLPQDAADDGEPDAIPSEPHCLASIRDNLEKLFGTLPTCNQEVYSQTSAMESSVDMAASPFQSLSSLGVEPSSLDHVGAEPMSDRRIFPVTWEQKRIDYETLGNEVASRLLREVLELKAIVRSRSSTSSKGSWKKYHKEKDVTVYRKVIPGRAIISFLGYGYIDADLNDVWQILRNPLSRLDFDPMTKKAELIEQISAKISVGLIVMEAKHCLVKQQRDMCVLAYEKNNGRRRFVVYRSIDHEQCPTTPGLGRAKVFNAGWQIESVELEGKTVCKVYYLIQVDPGRLPAVLVNYVSKRQPLVIANLRDFLAGQKETPPQTK
ncbi:uncharacterized protein [Oscarella lobularis]|uniref:uncharacterized protein isoform X2 n=1 Tax=Oscarella lobularis TaxID=121494 RepID=UPI0033141AAB